MRVEELVSNSRHYRTRVAATLDALQLKERASYLVDEEERRRVLAVAADRALVVMRMDYHNVGVGIWVLRSEVYPWGAVEGFGLIVDSQAGDSRESVDVLPSAVTFTKPKLDIRPEWRTQQAATEFAAACIEGLSWAR